MKQVGLRELKNRLCEYVRLVRASEHVQVTDRGQVVAELVPPTPAKSRDPAAGLAALERRGLLRHRRRSGSLQAPPPARSDRHRPAPPRRRPGRALIVYAESSAILAWLFGEPGGRPAVEALEPR